MKASLFRVVSVLMTVFFLSLSPQTWADESEDGLSDAARDGIGCAAFTSAALLGSFAAGPGELIMIAGGGSLAPSATAPLMVSLTATVFVAACGIGIAVMPAALWFSEQVQGVFSGLWGSRGAPAVDTHQPSGSVLAAVGGERGAVGSGALVVGSSR
jgi:hypothetical protein